MWTTHATQAWRIFMLHKLRSMLSMLGIIFGVVAVVAMLAIAEGAKRETLEAIQQLGTDNVIIRQSMLTKAQQAANQANLSMGLTRRDVALLAANLPGVLGVGGAREIKAAMHGLDGQGNFGLLAVSGSYREVLNMEMAQGRFICQEDEIQRSNVCVLGQGARQAAGGNGQVGGVIYLDGLPFKVVGLLKPRQNASQGNNALLQRDINSTVFIPIGAEPILTANAGYGELSEVIIKLSGRDAVAKSQQPILRLLSMEHGGQEDFQLIVPQELLKQAQKAQHIFNVVLGCIAAISLLVGGIGIMNIMLASVSERTREIGIRRAIGASRRHILVHFLWEAVIQTLLGGLIGLLVGCGSALLITRLAGWRTSLTPWSLLAALAMALVVGVLAGIYPANRAARLEPVEALRQ